MPETKAGFLVRLGELFRTHPVQMLVVTAAVLGAGAAVGILVFRALTSGGDEPPIRVKGGSIYLELIGPSFPFVLGDWDDKNDHWEVHDGRKNSLGVAIKTTSGNCPVFMEDVKKVTFSFTPDSNGVEITDYLTIDPGGNKTKISPKDGSLGKTDHSGKKLDFPGAGYISAVTVHPKTGGPQKYTFAKGEFEEAILF